MWYLRISEAVFKMLCGDTRLVLWAPIFAFVLLLVAPLALSNESQICVCRHKLTRQGYHFRQPLYPHGNPLAQPVSNYRCAYTSSGDLIKNANYDTVGAEWGLRLCISSSPRWCWWCWSTHGILRVVRLVILHLPHPHQRSILYPIDCRTWTLWHSGL